jgi:hypothetical protein
MIHAEMAHHHSDPNFHNSPGSPQAHWHPNQAPALAVPLSPFFNHVLDVLAGDVAAAGTSARDQAPQLAAAGLERWQMVEHVMLNGTWEDDNAAGLDATLGAGTSFLRLYRQVSTLGLQFCSQSQ